MSRTLHARTMSALRWTMINTVGERVLSFGTTMVLTRMLDPAHFGLYALAFVVIDSFQIVKNLGLDAALIQRQDRVEEAADTALMVLPVIGMAFFGLLYAVAPTVAVWLGNPEVGRPLQVLGLVLILMSVGNVPLALVQKAMRFDIRTIANLSGMTAYAVLAVTLAKRGFGVWSLVMAYLIRWLVSIPIQWMLLGWTPRWRFDGRLLREMLQFSKYVVGAWIVGLLAMNVDKLSVGRWLGATQLGYYTLCLGLANIVMSQLSVQVYQVAFPAFSEARGSQERLQRGFLKLTTYLLLFSLPVAVLFVSVPREFLEVVYGPKWVVAAPLLRVLALGGVLQTVRAGVESMLMGSGRSRMVFGLNLLQLVLLAVGAGSQAMAQRPTGVAWSVVAASAVPLAINLAIVMREIGMSPSVVLRRLHPVLASAALMAASLLAGAWLRPALGPWAQVSWRWLLCVAPLSVSLYGLGILSFDRPLVADLLKLVRWPVPAVVKGKPGPAPVKSLS